MLSIARQVWPRVMMRSGEHKREQERRGMVGVEGEADFAFNAKVTLAGHQ
jgi:hypothetical protein